MPEAHAFRGIIEPMFDWSLYSGNLSWLPERTIYLARHGSQAYGTSLPTSDEDFRGVAIAPAEYYLGGLHKFEQAECKSPDLTIFELRKFIGLAAQANPNVLEILFVDESDRLQVTPLGERLLAARQLFLSRRLKHTFSGYAHSQLKRIDRHYRWLKSPPSAPPTRAEFRLPERTLIPQDQLAAAEAGIRQKLDAWSVDFLDTLERDLREAVLQRMSAHLAELEVASNEELWRGAARVIGYSENFIELLDLEKRYAAKKREWDNYQEWKRTRNAARAALEAQFGYDTKHGMHLVRLIRMCREILTTGQVRVRRPDAEELLSNPTRRVALRALGRVGGC
ncbi:MAG: nucleotidyltransferase domain-containing protein [Polyangiaceae bacterium]